jgi:hypothetical protein
LAGLNAGSSQPPGEGSYRQEISMEGLKKLLASPTPNNKFELKQCKLSGQSLALIATKSWIHDLSLEDCDINNDSLDSLANLPLSRICLNNSTFNDVGAAKLSVCQGLQDVQASSTDLLDDGVRSLSTIKSLTRLSIAGAKITDKALIEIAKVKALYDLNLGSAKGITDRGLSALEHTNLTMLLLDDTSIGDDGLSHISKMPDLYTVKLNRTKVTVKGIKELCTSRSKLSKPRLRLLVKYCPNLGQKELQQLKAAFPAVRFEY